MLGDSGSPLLAQVLARLGIELYWSERERAIALCQQAADMARGVNDPHTLIVALWGRWLSLRNPDSLEQRLADTSEMIAVAESAGERILRLKRDTSGSPICSKRATSSVPTSSIANT
ncbi:hypothetical protein ACFIOY_10795 [Bradyrhizobium sp. TZ2]